MTSVMKEFNNFYNVAKTYLRVLVKPSREPAMELCATGNFQNLLQGLEEYHLPRMNFRFKKQSLLSVNEADV